MPQSLILKNESDGEWAKKTREKCEDFFLNLPTLIKHNKERKLLKFSKSLRGIDSRDSQLREDEAFPIVDIGWSFVMPVNDTSSQFMKNFDRTCQFRIYFVRSKSRAVNAEIVVQYRNFPRVLPYDLKLRKNPKQVFSVKIEIARGIEH